jgi:cytochrome c oxidase assembly protein subunit 15
MESTALYDLSPALRMALVGLVLATGPLAWVWGRRRQAQPASRLRALTLLTLFLTFDLVLFGAFTRLTDSGLGCPDWPGCYGSASPLGARQAIHSAQTAMPTGPVTHQKAWIEMVHRYLATGVGVLITALMVASWAYARRRVAALSPWWSTATFFWVCTQGAFGALTVTMKLYPAIVTLHLLGGLGLLALLAVQSQRHVAAPLPLSHRLHVALWGLFALSVAQIALGGWVSTNYAVLACTDFPTCHGSWWPEMDFEHGFIVLRELGAGKDGGYLPFAALTAIHYTHRLGAYVVLAVIAVLAWQMHRSRDGSVQRFGRLLASIALWQLLSGLSNVVLGWPLVAALAHTGGAAALITVLSVVLTRARSSSVASTRQVSSGRAARAAS